jgi:hypothetical protein
MPDVKTWITCLNNLPLAVPRTQWGGSSISTQADSEIPSYTETLDGQLHTSVGRRSSSGNNEDHTQNVRYMKSVSYSVCPVLFSYADGIPLFLQQPSRNAGYRVRTTTVTVATRMSSDESGLCLSLSFIWTCRLIIWSLHASQYSVVFGVICMRDLWR